MIYKLNKLGVYQPLLDAVNKVKSGINTTLTITYAYDQTSFSGVKSKTLSTDGFKTDILNSMFQWEKFASHVYSNRIHFDGNLTLKFKEVDLGSQDITISFGNIKEDIFISKTEIKFSKDAKWGTSQIPNKHDVMSYSVFAIGFLFGLESVGGITPMSSKYLSRNFNLSNNINPLEGGIVTTPVLHRYKKLFNHFKKIYGLLNSKMQVVYGCTDPSAENYNSNATTDDESCIESVSSYVHNSPNYYSLKSSRSVAEANTVNLAHYSLMYDYSPDGNLYSYTTEGIVFNSSTNIDIISNAMAANVEGSITSLCASVTSLNNGILNIVSIADWNSANGNTSGFDLVINDRLDYQIYHISKAYTGGGPSLGNIDPYNIASKNSLIQILDSFDGHRTLRIIAPGRTRGVEINLDDTPAGNENIDCVNGEDNFGNLSQSFIPAVPEAATLNINSISSHAITDAAASIWENYVSQLESATGTSVLMPAETNISGGTTIFPFNDLDWIHSITPPNDEVPFYQSVDLVNSSITGYFKRSAAFMSAHLKKFDGNVQKSIPEIKVLTICPIQDAYIVQRYSGLTDTATTGTVLIKSNLTTANADNKADVHFAHDTNINTVVYEFSSGYYFYDTASAGTEGFSFGLQKASISKWTKSILDEEYHYKFNGVLSEEEDSTIVYPLKDYPVGQTVFGNSYDPDTAVGNLEATVDFISASAGGSSGFPANYIFATQVLEARTVPNTELGINEQSYWKPIVRNNNFDLNNHSLAFHKTNNYPLIIGKKLYLQTTIQGNQEPGGGPIYDTTYSGASLNDDSLFYPAALNEPNNAVGHKLVFIGFKYGFFITTMNNLSGELNSTIQMSIPAGDNSLLGYEDVDTFEGGFLMIDFAVSLHNNFLYAIVEDPDTADRHIVVYDISLVELADGAVNEEYILQNSKSIPNPLSSNLSSVSLEKDGNIYFYSNNSTEYIKVSEPDLQVSVDTLLNFASTLIIEVPVEGSGMNVINASSNIFDFLKFHQSAGYLTINNESTESEINNYNAAYSLDPSTEMQLNITPDLPKGQYLPIGDQEKYRILSDELLFNINYGESGDFYTPVSSVAELDDLMSTLSASSIRLSYNKNNRIISFGNHIVALLVHKLDNTLSLYDRLGNVLADFDSSFELISVENIVSGVTADYRIIGSIVSRGVRVLGYYTLTFPEDSAQTSGVLDGISLGVIDVGFESFTQIVTLDETAIVTDSFIANTDLYNTTNLYFGFVDSNKIQFKKYIINSAGFTTVQLFDQPMDSITIDNISITNFDLSNSILKVSNGYLVLSFEANFVQGQATNSKPALLIHNLTTNTSSIVFASDIFRAHITSLEITNTNIFYLIEKNGIVDEFNYYSLTTSGYLSVPKLESQLYTTVNNQPVEQYPVDFDLCTADCNSNDFSTLVDYNPSDASINNITGLLKHPNGQIYISTDQVPVDGQYLSRVLNPTTNTPSYALHISTVVIEEETASAVRSQSAINFRDIQGESGGIIEDPDQLDSAFQMPLFSCIDPDYSHWCGYNQEDADTVAYNIANNIPQSIYHNTNLCGEEPSAEVLERCPNGGCVDNGTYNAYQTVYACGTCTEAAYSAQAEITDLQICGVCPDDTPDALNAVGCPSVGSPDVGGGPQRALCVEDIRMCQYGGCHDAYPPSSNPPQQGGYGNLNGLGLSCNGFGLDQSYWNSNFPDAANFPTVHDGTVCVHPTQGCECNGNGGLQSILIADIDFPILLDQDNNPLWSNCTDCQNDPDVFLPNINIASTIWQSGFTAVYYDYNNDSYNSGNAYVPYPINPPTNEQPFCNCTFFRDWTYSSLTQEQIELLWSERKVCDCQGRFPAAMEGLGPYCDCFGNYDTAKYCDCNTKKTITGPYCNCDGTTIYDDPSNVCYDQDGNILCDEQKQYFYYDLDGDGTYTCSDPVFECPYDIGKLNEAAGYTKYIAISEEHQCDDCDGVIDCFGQCVPYLLDGNLSGPVAVPDECGNCGGPGPIYDCPNADGVEGCESLPPPNITEHPVTGAEITVACDCSGHVDYGCGCNVSEVYDPYSDQYLPVPINGGSIGFTSEGSFVGPCNPNIIFDYCGYPYDRSINHSSTNPQHIFQEDTGFIVAQHRLNQIESGIIDPSYAAIYFCSCPVYNENTGTYLGDAVPYNQCCPGYTYVECHGCRADEVAATLQSGVDCAGRCPDHPDYQGVYDPETNTGGGIDECGICDGPGINAEGCCGQGIKDCNDNCVDPGGDGGNIFDECGVCGGDNTVFPDGEPCAGCTDPNAYNYVEGLVVDDGSCQYFEITNPQDYPEIVVAQTETTPVFDTNIVITHHTNVNVITRPAGFSGGLNEYDDPYLAIGLPLTLRRLYIFNEVNSINLTTHSILKDNRTLTDKCQVISRNNPYLYLTNVALYGEVTYNLIVDEHDPGNDGFTSGGFINTGMSVSSSNVVDIDEVYGALEPALNEIGENTVATITERSAVFYFRIEADSDNESPFVEGLDVTPTAIMSNLIINNIVSSVVKEDLGEVEILEAGVVSDEQITSTVNKYNWNQAIPQNGQVSDPAEIIVSDPQPNYHVYKVIMGTDPNGLPFDVHTPIDLSWIFKDLSNTTVMKPVCGDCSAFDTPYALLNGGPEYGNISIGGVQHYSYYNLTAVQFNNMVASGVQIEEIISESDIATSGVTHVYYYDASKCSEACIDPCLAISDNVIWQCCNENAENSVTNPDGFYPSCERCWASTFFQGPSPCIFPTPDPTPVCTNPDYLEYYGYSGIDISVNPVDENGMPIAWLPDPSQCITLISGDTDVDVYEDPEGNYSTTVESLPGTTTDIEFFIFDKKGKILFDHTDVLGRSFKRSTYNTNSLIRRVAGIRSMADCAGFVPIAFRTNEDWLNLRLTIREAEDDIYQLNFGEMNLLYSTALTSVAYGSADTPDGSALLQTEGGQCSVGCDDFTIDLPEACVRKVAIDVKEYTDFSIEIITEQSPEEAYSSENSEFIVYNIETGEKLVKKEILSAGITDYVSFRLLKSTPIGVKAKSRNMLIYKIMDEKGTVIQSKTVYNDAYFEPFKIELVTPGCTDTTAANYDSNAVIDDGSCLDGVLYDCVKSALFDIDILQCDTRENTRSLQIYTIYQSYKEAVKENNEVKIEMYGDKLTELCNCKTC